MGVCVAHTPRRSCLAWCPLLRQPGTCPLYIQAWCNYLLVCNLDLQSAVLTLAFETLLQVTRVVWAPAGSPNIDYVSHSMYLHSIGTCRKPLKFESLLDLHSKWSGRKCQETRAERSMYAVAVSCSQDNVHGLGKHSVPDCHFGPHRAGCQAYKVMTDSG